MLNKTDSERAVQWASERWARVATGAKLTPSHAHAFVRAAAALRSAPVNDHVGPSMPEIHGIEGR